MDTEARGATRWHQLRIVLLGKTGVGKSATGNTILNRVSFDEWCKPNSETRYCTTEYAERFGREIQVVYTPGLFDTHLPNDVVQKKIIQCIGMTSPGPHCFLLVLQVGRFREEEKQCVDHLVKYFGNNVHEYFIILFTRKDDLEHCGQTLEEHLRSVPAALQEIIQHCGWRCIAFNNREKAPQNGEQVSDLLNMIDDLVSRNNGACYTNAMYEKAENMIQKRENEIAEERKIKYEKEVKMIQDEVKKQKVSNAKMQEIMERKLKSLEEKYRKLQEPRKQVVEELQTTDSGIGDVLLDGLKSVAQFFWKFI